MRRATLWLGLAAAAAALVAVLAAVPSAQAQAVTSNPYWEVKMPQDGTWAAQTGVSHGPTAGWDHQSITRLWTLGGSQNTWLTIRTNTTDYWQGTGNLAPSTGQGLEGFGVYHTWNISSGLDQLYVKQRISVGGVQADQSWVLLEITVCNNNPVLPTAVGIRTVEDQMAGMGGTDIPAWAFGEKSWISAPPAPYTAGAPDQFTEVRNYPTELGYVFAHPNAGPLQYIGLLNEPNPPLPWLPVPVVPPDRFAYTDPMFNSWDATNPWGGAAGDEMTMYWWGYQQLIPLAKAGDPGSCTYANAYWIPLAAIFPPPPPVPSVDFTRLADTPTCMGQTFFFDGASAPAGPGWTWSWDFGDGSPPGVGQSVSHTYTASGAKTVTLSATNPNDNTVYTKSWVVYPILAPPCPPVLDKVPMKFFDVGDLITTCATGHDGMGGALTFTVDLLPSGAVFDPATNCVSWTPTEDQAGLYCFYFTLTEAPRNLRDEGCHVLRIRAPHGAPTVDTDMDGRPDDADNCPNVANFEQADTDHDGIGDSCQAAGPQFPRAANAPRLPTPEDLDADGVRDLGDNCPGIANSDQADGDGDSVGDICDLDIDGDGIANGADNCPLKPNRDQRDLDGDLHGDTCDTNPGVPDTASRADAGVGSQASRPSAASGLTSAQLSRMGFGAMAFVAVLGASLLVASRKK